MRDTQAGTVQTIARLSITPAMPQLISKFKESMSTTQVTHPMVKFQNQVRSLVEAKLVKPTDSLWQIALIFGDEWPHWKKELGEFGFTTQDPISELLAVEGWDDE